MPLPSLSEWFESVFVGSFQVGNQPRTLKEYRVTLGKWKRKTSDPPMDVIDSLMLGEFKGWLLDVEKLARATVNKHVRHVHTILGRLARRAMVIAMRWAFFRRLRGRSRSRSSSGCRGKRRRRWWKRSMRRRSLLTIRRWNTSRPAIGGVR